jgi:hypothetical protein
VTFIRSRLEATRPTVSPPHSPPGGRVASCPCGERTLHDLEQAQVAKARQEEEELRKLKAALAEQRVKTDRLLAQLANAEDDDERAKLQQQLATCHS